MGTSEQALIGWHRLAADVRWNVRPFINGDYRDSASLQGVENVNPATESVLCEFSAGGSDDVDAAVRTSRARFDDGSWSGLPPRRRVEVLRTLADLVAEEATDLALLDSLEMGKPIRDALYDVEVFGPNLLRSWAGFADQLWGASGPLSPAVLSLNVYEPRGVVGAIAPWNFPLSNAIYKIAPALAAGNAVVLKPSEVSPSSALRLAELALAAGVPDGVLNVVPGLGMTVGEALVQHPDVDMISFTGSTLTGRRIMESAGRTNAKPVLLECGGKSPHLVFESVENLETVADAVVSGFLRNQGQVCSAHTRLIVHEAISQQLVERVVSAAAEYRFADPLDEATTFGPLGSPAQRDRVVGYIERALEAGAEPLLQGDVRRVGGCFVGPTVLGGVDSEMPVVREEIFGPVLCVQLFASEDEAVRLANGTEFGLAATVWTRDLAQGRRLAHRIRAGYVFVRTGGEEVPEWNELVSFEPRKASGFGAEIGKRGLESYSTLKAVMFSGE